MKPTVRLARLTRIAATATLALATTLAAHAQTLRMAVTDIVGLENLQREYAPFQKILSEKSGMKVELFPVPNRTAAVEALNGPQDCVEEIRGIYKGRRDTLVSSMKPEPR